ncbi:MAG TPA: dinitrogenase iron-molybdenum cofactor biosynthesis protein [Thermoflexia bacterium]|nr:dinitrogenase iron-molybdenum cofactor biosynthesis protein [Thermoflexia bacterium]
MRIAISADNSAGLESIVAHHFGRCPYYAFVDVEGREVQNVTVLPNPHYEQHRPNVVPPWIEKQGGDVMLAGGMGRRAVALFKQAGIQAHTGAAGTVRRALEQFLGGKLEDARPCEEHQYAGEHEHAADESGEGELTRLKEEAAALKAELAEAAQRLDSLG